MARARPREFWCPVVSESVVIRLRRSTGLSPTARYVVQCNQSECQYVEENKPPCPLNVEMFAAEIAAAEADRSARRDE